MKKRFFALALSAALALSLAACGGQKDTAASAQPAATAEVTAPAESTAAAESVAPTESAAATESVAPVATAAPAETVKIEGALQLGLAYGAAHGTKCFSEAYAVVQGDVIVAAYLDDFQFVAADTEGITPVPNSDSDLGAGFAEGQVLCSKRAIADYYSALMASKAGSTVRIDDNFDAIQSFVVGKTIAEVESVAGQSGAVDAVSGATLADTAGYLKLIAQAARNAQANQAVEFSGSSDELKLSAILGAANGTRSFSQAAALTNGETILLSYLDEFQFMDVSAEVTGVPNSDSDFAAGYAEGQVLCSKRAIAAYYSELMATKGGSTVRIDDNYDAIQNAVNGMTIAGAQALAGQENAADAVSGATLAATTGYVALIVVAAQQ